MSKSRGEMVTATADLPLSDKLEEILNSELHLRAKLKREEKDGKVIFTFFPIKGELLVIGIQIAYFDKIIENERHDANAD